MQAWCGQFAVAFDVMTRMVAQNRAMCGRDEIDLQRLDQRQRAQHVILERPHDVRVVVLEGKPEVAYPIVEQQFIAVVTAEHIT